MSSKRTTCPGSGQRVNAFPGEDVCPACERWVRVKQDSTFGKHAVPISKRNMEEGGSK